MVVEFAWKTFKNNLSLLLVFSVSFLLGFLIPIIASTPTYNAIGGVFLRFMSIPEMNYIDAIFMAIAFLISNYFISFGIVATNLIVKKERMMINLTREILNSISKYTAVIFMVFVFLFVVNAAVQILLTELQAPYWLSAIIFLAIYLPSFYIGPAIVIDEMKPFHALLASADHIKKYPMRIVKWVAGGLAMLFATTYVSYFVAPAYFQWITILINSFLIIPFLLVYQSHSYLEKYGILKKKVRKKR